MGNSERYDDKESSCDYIETEELILIPMFSLLSMSYWKREVSFLASYFFNSWFSYSKDVILLNSFSSIF